MVMSMGTLYLVTGKPGVGKSQHTMLQRGHGVLCIVATKAHHVREALHACRDGDSVCLEISTNRDDDIPAALLRELRTGLGSTKAELHHTHLTVSTHLPR